MLMNALMKMIWGLGCLFLFDVSYIGLRLYLDKKRRKIGG